jgi:hypothetical protein
MAASRAEKVLCSGATEARSMALKMLHLEARGPGDLPNAMRRLGRRHGLSWRVFWTLRYRPPPDVFVGVYRKLEAAYLAELERQQRLLRHDIEITRLKAGPDHPAVRAAETLVGAKVDD